MVRHRPGIEPQASMLQVLSKLHVSLCKDLGRARKGCVKVSVKNNPAQKVGTAEPEELLHAQYDWTTGAPDNGNEWRKFGAVPRLCAFPCVPLFCTLLSRVGNKRAFRLPGAGGDHSIAR